MQEEVAAQHATNICPLPLLMGSIGTGVSVGVKLGSPFVGYRHAVASTGFLLKEDGGHLLKEDGGRIRL